MSDDLIERLKVVADRLDLVPVAQQIVNVVREAADRITQLVYNQTKLFTEIDKLAESRIERNRRIEELEADKKYANEMWEHSIDTNDTCRNRITELETETETNRDIVAVATAILKDDGTRTPFSNLLAAYNLTIEDIEGYTTDD